MSDSVVFCNFEHDEPKGHAAQENAILADNHAPGSHLGKFPRCDRDGQFAAEAQPLGGNEEFVTPSCLAKPLGDR